MRGSVLSRLKQSRKKWALTILVLSLLLILAAIVSAAVGPADIAAVDVAQMILHHLLGMDDQLNKWPMSHKMIVFQVRLPRIVLAVIVGGGLAMAGATYQGLLQNSMADPYIIGVSAGSVGATIGILLRNKYFAFGLSVVTLLAFVSSTTIFWCIYSSGRRTGAHRHTPFAGRCQFFLLGNSVVLDGCSHQSMPEIVYWMMGSLSGRSWNHVKASLPYLVLGGLVVLFYSRELNILLVGEETAQNLGVNVERVKAVLLIAGSLMAAAAVSVSGVIGFVGLIIPHSVRIVTGPDHRILLPAAGLVGAIFLVIADTLARIILAPAELPVGVITAIAGAPFFIYLLRRQKQSRY